MKVYHELLYEVFVNGEYRAGTDVKTYAYEMAKHFKLEDQSREIEVVRVTRHVIFTESCVLEAAYPKEYTMPQEMNDA